MRPVEVVVEGKGDTGFAVLPVKHRNVEMKISQRKKPAEEKEEKEEEEKRASIRMVQGRKKIDFSRPGYTRSFRFTTLIHQDGFSTR